MTSFSDFTIPLCAIRFLQKNFPPPALVLFVMLGIGCGAGGKQAPMEAPAGITRETLWEGAGYQPEAPAFRDMSNLYGSLENQSNAAVTAQETRGVVPDSAQRKLVKNASLRIRVEDPAAADTSITALMEKYRAYASRSDTGENSRSYIIQVPADNYGLFLTEAGAMGRVLRRSESAEDVTVRYYDLEGRLATKRELLKTFQSYLGRAKKIEEILSVEERIAELQSDIEGTGQELRRLASMVDYAAVSIEIFGPLGADSAARPGLGERVLELFVFFGEFASTLVLVLAGIVIYGIPSILILVLLFFLLFGKIGLLKKLWRLAAGKKQDGK
jgi:hypothetical protein